jgi:protocatechuate 3,4-dioxygenase beta subunit
VLKMTPFSDIAGQVLDEDGHAMEGVEIYSGVTLRAGTDSEGRYRVAELVPGEYRLYCRLFAMRENLIQHDAKTGEVRGYADSYFFPGVEGPARAAHTNVAAGVHVGGFDSRLRRVPLVEFSGRVVDINHEPLRTAAVELSPQTTFLPDQTRQRRRVKPMAVFASSESRRASTRYWFIVRAP